MNTHFMSTVVYTYIYITLPSTCCMHATSVHSKLFESELVCTQDGYGMHSQ